MRVRHHPSLFWKIEMYYNGSPLLTQAVEYEVAYPNDGETSDTAVVYRSCPLVKPN